MTTKRTKLQQTLDAALNELPQNTKKTIFYDHAGTELPVSFGPKVDNVNHPTHYTQGGIECIDALAAATINLRGIEAVCTANAIKYLWRWQEKGGAEDLLKARWYINRLLGENQ